MGHDNGDRRLRSAILGNRVVPRGDPSWVKAARFLDAAGYPDAAAELFRASQGKPHAFWDAARLEALARVDRCGTALAEHTVEPLATFELLRALVGFCTIEAVNIVKRKRQPDQMKLVLLRRAIGALAENILDVSDPDWRSKLERSDY